MRIAIYTDQDRFQHAVGDTAYLHEALEDAFHVSVHWTPDASLCASADVVFIRFSRARPPPVSFLRDLVGLSGKLFVNPPETLLRFGSKRLLGRFPELTVPTVITTSPTAILGMARRRGAIVLKPLNSHSGKGIVRIDVSSMSESDVATVVEQYVALHGAPVVQPFIDRVQEWGDKRINVFGYEVVSAVRTYPAEGSFICHRSAGGHEVTASLSDDDARILEHVIPFLRENEIWWAGIDVIGPYLGEVNIVSPMMIRRADEAHGDTRGREAVVRRLQRYAVTHGL